MLLFGRPRINRLTLSGKIVINKRSIHRSQTLGGARMNRSCQKKASLVTFVSGCFLMILSLVVTCIDNQCLRGRQSTSKQPIIDEQTDRAAIEGLYLASILLFCVSVCLTPRTSPSRLRPPSSASEEEGRQLITSAGGEGP